MSPHHPWITASPRRLWNWGDLALIFGIGLVLLSIGLTAAVSTLITVLAHTTQITQNLTIASLLIEALALTGSVYIWGLRRKHLNWTTFGIRPVSSTWIWGAMALGLATRVVATVLASLAQFLWHLSVTTQQTQVFLPSDITWMGILCITVLGGAFVPLAEEVVFRGVLFPFMSER